MGRDDDKDREKDKDRDRDRERDRDRDRDRERGRDRDGDRDRDRHKSSKSKHSRRSRSRSRDRDHKKSSRHRSKSAEGDEPHKPRPRRRPTGFDVLPGGVPGGPPLPGLPAAASGAPGAVPGAPAGFTHPAGGAAAANAAAFAAAGPSQQATRHARRVYVGGLPPTANEQNIATFFSNALAAVGGTTAGPGPAVVNVYINYEKKFAFVECRTVDETSNAMGLDGIMFEGVSVRVRRPNDYNPAAAAGLGPANPSPNLNLAAIGLTPGGGGPGGPPIMGGGEQMDRVFVGGLPYYLSQEQCEELLSSFGPLRSFDLVKDRDTGQSKGYGFVVYADPSVTDVACAGLNGMRMGERTLTVRRATESAPNQQMGAQHTGMMPAAMNQAPPMPEMPASRIISLLEAVTPAELADDGEYSEILEDMKEECGRYGAVRSLHIPRPNTAGGPDPPGVGKVIVEYADVSGAMAGRTAMHGRRFAGRTVSATFLPEAAFSAGQF